MNNFIPTSPNFGVSINLQDKDSYNVPIENMTKRVSSSLYFSRDEFLDFNNLLYRISLNCKPGGRYSLLTRALFVDPNSESISTIAEWKTLDSQIGVTYDNEFKVSILNYSKAIQDRLTVCEEKYEYKDLTQQGFQVLLYRVSYTDKMQPIKKVSLNSLGKSKDLLNVSKTIQGINSLPLTTNKGSFGKLLDKQLNGSNVKFITLLSGEKINLKDKINVHLDINTNWSFPHDADFYQEGDYITVVTNVEVDDINKSVSHISIYNTSGILINKMIDRRIDDIRFSRKVGNVEIYLDSKGVYNKVVEWVFNRVHAKKIVGYFSKLIYSDSRVGSLDLETYKNQVNVSKTYAIGFYTKDNLNTFYIEDDLNSDKLIMKCLDNMLIEKYNGYTFFVHNLEGYDSPFLLKVMVDATFAQPNIYRVEPLLRDEKILSIKFSKKVGPANEDSKGKRYTIKFVDSYNFLASSLFKLSRTFNCEIQKGTFPYKFVRGNNLFYVGNKPRLDLYDYSNYVEDIDDIGEKNKVINDLYNEIPTHGWSTKVETIKYLEKDLISLFDIMDSFKKGIFSKYYTHVTRSLTISGLAMDIFLRRFYDNNIPLVNKKSVYGDIKNSYFGGITEVYKPCGKDLYYYDVNSLYPYSALNDMPGLKCRYINNINSNICNYKEEMFGFYHCSVEAPNSYFGLLPVRTKSGVVMPIGKFDGWYFSEELKFAYEHGYNITINKGYSFDRVSGVFDKYVKEFFRLKYAAKNGVERSIAKSLLNNLLGRFGMKIDKSITELVNEDKYNEITQSREVKGFKRIGDRYLVTYGSNISPKMCYDHNVDFNSAFNESVKHNKISGFSEDRLSDVSIAVASAVTSYSRIHMNKLKLNILNSGGSIYYTDTDSIVTDTKLDDSYVNDDLGKLKLEHKIKDGYFISNKTYSFINFKDKVITRTKGIYNKSLKFDDFIKLYDGINVRGVRSESVKNYSEGYVNINEVPITISPDSYTKRDKVYNNNLWVDTKPIVYS